LLGAFDGDMPTINQDGRWIALVAGYNVTGNNPDFSSEILLYDRERRTFRQITDGPTSCFNLNPKISANGTRIAYLSTCNPAGGNADGNFEVFVAENPALNMVMHAEGNVNLIVTDPQGRAIFAGGNSIPGASYQQGDGDTVPEVRITIERAEEGRFLIFVVGLPGAAPSDPVTIDGTLNGITVQLASDSLGALASTPLSFANQGFKRRSSRIKPLAGLGSLLTLRARMPHPRAAAGGVFVLFNDGTNEQRFDFPPIETFYRGRTFTGTLDGFATKLRVVGNDLSTSLSLKAKHGDLSEFAGLENLNMTIAVQVGPDTDMYNFRFRRSPTTGQLALK
jgi:hypothetical protein